MSDLKFCTNNICAKVQKPSHGDVRQLPINSIVSKSNSKKSKITEEELWGLSYSIKTYGVVQPVIVKSIGMGTYELLAGERRIKAARLAGLTSVPALVYENEEKDNSLLLMTFLENVKRSNLSLIDEARAYADILNQFDISAERLAVKLGKQPYEIESKVEILELPDYVLEKIDEYKLSIFHAHSLLKIKNPELLKKALTNICVRQFDAKQTESYIDNLIANHEDFPSSQFSVKDVKILTNTIMQIAQMLKKCGDSETVKINDTDNSTEFTLKIPKTS